MPCRLKSYSTDYYERTEFHLLVRHCRNRTKTIPLNNVNSKIRSSVPKFRISENFFGSIIQPKHCYFRT